MTTSPLLPPLTAGRLRRRILACVALALLGLGGAAAKEPRQRTIAYFSVLPPQAPSSVTALARFREGLRDHGFTEGADYRIEYRWEERIEKLPGRMRELMSAGPSLVVAITTPVALAAARATRGVPVVFGTVSDPVASGLVDSLARPGGNVTGVANILPALSGKLIELAREILPHARRIAVLWNPDNPAKALELRELERHAQPVGIELALFPVRSAAHIESAVSGLDPGGVAALVVLAETLTNANRERIARLALAARMPTLFNHAPQVEAGGLAAYSPDYDLQTTRLGELAGRILAGASPATLPVEQPTRYLLTVNVKTAKALGIEVPRSILLRAERVIE
ncbi:MAG: ABC transporter substrate-binding protein [Burkholderiales bacterium]